MRSLTVSRAALGASVVAFLVYVRTMAPSVSFIDSGELATVAAILGIAHPTGYPLFTLIGRVWTMLPFPGEEIVRLNLMAAVMAAAGIYVFVRLTGLVLGRLSDRDGEALDGLRGAVAGAAGLVLAFSETYWSVAVSIEVYALHVLFLTLVLFCFLRAVETSRMSWWYLFAFLLGLSFSNHMTTILLAPGLLFLYFSTQGRRREVWWRILRMVLPLVAGLSVYLYLPLRAMSAPALNWGNPVSLERLVWHVSGKQYRVWIFSSTEAAGRQFSHFLSTLPGEMAVPGLVIGILGLVAMGRRDWRMAGATIVLFLTTVLYSINYDIQDIDSYFLLAYLTLAIWVAAGLAAIGRWCLMTLRLRPAAVAAALLLVGGVPLLSHYEEIDESSNYLVEDYTHNMFSSLQPDALVLSYQWDYWVSAACYYQLVRRYRTDVAVIDKELLRRSWYYPQLASRHPWLIQGSSAEVEAFLAELAKFEHERPYDSAVIQARYVAMIRSFISRSLPVRPVYVTGEIEEEFTRGLQRVPEGLAFRLYADTLFHPSPEPKFSYRPFSRTGRLEDLTRTMYAQSLTARGAYYLVHGKPDEAEKSLNSAIFFDPGFSQARRLLSLLGR
jgi:hypothetical protein